MVTTPDEFCHADGTLTTLKLVAPDDSETVMAVAEAALPPGVRPASVIVMVSEPAPPWNSKVSNPVSIATVSDAETARGVAVASAEVTVMGVSAAIDQSLS